MTVDDSEFGGMREPMSGLQKLFMVAIPVGIVLTLVAVLLTNGLSEPNHAKDFSGSWRFSSVESPGASLEEQAVAGMMLEGFYIDLNGDWSASATLGPTQVSQGKWGVEGERGLLLLESVDAEGGAATNVAGGFVMSVSGDELRLKPDGANGSSEAVIRMVRDDSSVSERSAGALLGGFDLSGDTGAASDGADGSEGVSEASGDASSGAGEQ